MRAGQWVVVQVDWREQVGIVFHPAGPGRWRVHVVDARGLTVKEIEVGEGELRPVQDVKQIPPARRETMAPGWRPRPVA